MNNNAKHPSMRLSWGGLTIAEWSNEIYDRYTSQSKIIKSYTLSKETWNQDTKKIERQGSISINRKEHFTLIGFLIEKSKTTGKDESLLDYSFKLIKDCDQIRYMQLVKSYKDKDGKDVQQSMDLTGLDVVYLRTLIRVFEDISVAVNDYSNPKGKTTSETVMETFVDSRVVEDGQEPEIDDDIPF